MADWSNWTGVPTVVMTITSLRRHLEPRQMVTRREPMVHLVLANFSGSRPAPQRTLPLLFEPVDPRLRRRTARAAVLVRMVRALERSGRSLFVSCNIAGLVGGGKVHRRTVRDKRPYSSAGRPSSPTRLCRLTLPPP